MGERFAFRKRVNVLKTLSFYPPLSMSGRHSAAGKRMAAIRKSETPAPSATLSRDEALRVLEQRARNSQEELASQVDAGDDVLGYLAENGAVATRRAVAANPGAPASANFHLANDEDEDVRAELARKIGRLMPDLSKDERDHVRELTIATLEKLAEDQVPRVRAILAQEIRALTCIPKPIALALARDAEAIVSAPILQYSPLLSDADLKEIIATARVSEVLAAIARRNPLRASVTDAIVSTLDIPAVAALLTNREASIRAQTLERIAAQAEEVVEWHTPLMLRADLSPRAIRRLAGFVGRSLVEKLLERNGLDGETRHFLERRLRERLDQPKSTKDTTMEAARAEVEAAKREGRFNAAFIEGAAELGRRDTLICALAELTDAPVETVRKILLADTAKPITALVWRAGLQMRTSFTIQRFAMKLPAGELLPARSGVGFPLEPEEMQWHLGLFGID
jgi:uncharacterized protein (DUF2336 family)